MILSTSLDYQNYLLIFVGVVNFVFGFFILVNDPRNKVNISFTLFSLSLTLWTFLLAVFKNTSIDFQPFIMRLIHVSGLCVAMALWFFSQYFPDKKSPSIVVRAILLTVFTLVSLSVLIPGVLTENISYVKGAVPLKPVGHFLFFGVFYIYCTLALVTLSNRLRTSSLLLRKQALFLLAGISIAFIFGGFFNIILPSVFFNNFSFIYLGPLFILFIVLFVGYSVAKYQLMNVKALATELYVTILVLILVPDIFLAETFTQILFRILIVTTVIFFSYLLVRSILKEVLRREQITKLAQDLQDANTRLQELDRQKTEFLSIASHQLRTPLSVINGYIGLLQDGAYGKPPTEMKEIFQNMDESNTRLTKLVDEFLDITRIEQGRTKFYYAPHDVNEIIDSAVKELRERAAQKGVQLVWEHTVPHIASVDDEKIRHGIYNFIDNAIKYTEQGTVVVKLESRDGGLAYTVTDEGLGFNENDRLNFFQKFYRGENVQGTNVNGTGLGLYVVSKFIEAHGGKVWAKSPGLGKGSEFGFWIPLDREKRKNEA